MTTQSLSATQRPAIIGRPTLTFSRRRRQESIKALKALINNPKQPAEIKLRSISMLAMIYGVQEPETRYDRVAVRELVMQKNADENLTAQVDRRIAAQDAQKLVQMQEKALAEAQQAKERADAALFAHILSKT
jgi:hypothetical protein